MSLTLANGLYVARNLAEAILVTMPEVDVPLCAWCNEPYTPEELQNINGDPCCKRCLPKAICSLCGIVKDDQDRAWNEDVNHDLTEPCYSCQHSTGPRLEYVEEED